MSDLFVPFASTGKAVASSAAPEATAANTLKALQEKIMNAVENPDPENTKRRNEVERRMRSRSAGGRLSTVLNGQDSPL